MVEQKNNQDVWVNAGGRIVCGEHGGDYLTSAIKAGQGPHIVTPLDDWLLCLADEAAELGFECETCAAGR